MLTSTELTGMRDTSTEALPDTGAVTRRAGRGAFDPDTGLHADPDPNVVYDGACRIRPLQAMQHTGDFGDLPLVTAGYVVTLPHDTDDVQVDDWFSPSVASDTSIVGRPFRVVHVQRGSYLIDRRIVVEDSERSTAGGAGS